MEVDKFVKITVNVQTDHADAVRTAMGEAGAGRLGNYQYFSFSIKGTGRFIPLKEPVGLFHKMELNLQLER